MKNKLSNDMKTLITLVIVLFCFMGIFIIPAVGQDKFDFPTDNVTYEITQTDIFFNGKQITNVNDILVEFRDNYIITTFSGQMKKIIIEEKWRNHSFNIDGKEIPHLLVQAHDSGGFSCFLNYGYSPNIGKYFLWVTYNNVYFCHWMDKSEREMYDIRHTLPPHTEDTGEYTSEDVERFLNAMGKLKHLIFAVL